MSIYDTFCANLRTTMADKGFTQSQLALDAGYSISYLSRVLNGTQQNPTLEFLACVAGALGTTPQALLEPTQP